MAYQAIAKLKPNDVQAFNLLNAHYRSTIRPIFEIVTMPDDADPEKHLAKALNALSRYKLGCVPAVDLNRFAPDTRIHGQSPARLGFNAMLGRHQFVTPVVHLDSDSLTLLEAVKAAEQHGHGLCVRLEGSDIVRAPEMTIGALRHLVHRSAVGAPGVDLLLDFGKLAFEQDVIVTATTAFLRTVDGYGLNFRNVTFSGSTVVDFVNEAAEEESTGSVIRTEFAAWMRIAQRYGWDRPLHFADCSVIRPGYMDNVRNKHANIKIRYTSGASIHYIRGCSKQKSPASVQYPLLAKKLIGSPFFMNESFSHGDAFFASAAIGLNKNSDIGRWIQMESNHHLTFVGGQVERFLALTAAQRTSDEQLDAFMFAD